MLTSALFILQILFLFCKLAEVTAIAAWSWTAVMSPLIAIVFLVLLYLLFVGLGMYIGTKKSKN